MQMKTMDWQRRFNAWWTLSLILGLICGIQAQAPVDLLSWHDGAAKAPIVSVSR